jgi:hypothetical protein
LLRGFPLRIHHARGSQLKTDLMKIRDKSSHGIVMLRMQLNEIFRPSYRVIYGFEDLI